MSKLPLPTSMAHIQPNTARLVSCMGAREAENNEWKWMGQGGGVMGLNPCGAWKQSFLSPHTWVQVHVMIQYEGGRGPKLALGPAPYKAYWQSQKPAKYGTRSKMTSSKSLKMVLSVHQFSWAVLMCTEEPKWKMKIKYKKNKKKLHKLNKKWQRKLTHLDVKRKCHWARRLWQFYSPQMSRMSVSTQSMRPFRAETLSQMFN